MCTVSNIGDNWRDTAPIKWPIIYDSITTTNHDPLAHAEIQALKVELASLKKEMKELKKLLKAAKKFDEATDQPHCEVDEKVALIKKMADLVGVDLKDVFG